MNTFGAIHATLLRLLAVLLALGLPGAVGAAPPPEQEIAQGVIARMEHVAVDYPYVVRGGETVDTAEYQGLHDFAAESVALLAQLPPRPEQDALLAQARHVQAGIDARAGASEVVGPARGLGRELMRIYRLSAAPRQTPNLHRAQALYQLECAVCHGQDGRGDGPVARGLQPPPGDFLDPARMGQQSILALYDAITTGLKGQPGHGAHLPFADRWALAFLVSGLRDPLEAVRRGEALWREGQGHAELPDLRTLVLQSPAEIERQGGDALDAVRAFLTLHPEALETSRPAELVLARGALRELVSAYARGDIDQARRLAVVAHAEGLAPVASRLDQADPALRSEIARELLALRAAIEARQHAGTVVAHAARIELLLDRAADLLARDARAAKAIFASSLLILLREGSETILVLATMGALVRRTGRPGAMRYLHAGWFGALLLGLLTWFAAAGLLAFAGVEHELAEGVTNLLAAAMLLYVGPWLHKQTHLDAWETFLRQQASAALAGRKLWAVTGVAFLAVYRELFEMVLLYQVLWTQAGEQGQRAVAAGLATAAVLLAVLAWFIVRYGTRLPVARFHAATSLLLAGAALVFVGHGISALQEAQALPATSVRFVTLPLLGIHPTLQGLAAQALVLALIATRFLLRRRQR
ncbi:FTR1 family protein [Ramlibacter monticola]|uniref:FTR1 family protein n=1 Tax=Ramlibacter monticola TaxID=1926872 RepID=A0A937CUF3_9BURK|nr:FTR1 family protein [Ramlibacter monticola]MBL0393316.1 FTR1 family protein [Ramlibacter monticola]